MLAVGCLRCVNVLLLYDCDAELWCVGVAVNSVGHSPFVVVGLGLWLYWFIDAAKMVCFCCLLVGLFVFGLFTCGALGRCLLLIICWVVSKFGFA